MKLARAGTEESKRSVFYRAYVPRYAPVIAYEHWYLYKETPKGFWIIQGREHMYDPTSTHGKKWVGLDTRFVSPTKEEALGNLWARKRSHVRHARRRLKEAARAFRLVNIECGGAPRLLRKYTLEERIALEVIRNYP